MKLIPYWLMVCLVLTAPTAIAHQKVEDRETRLRAAAAMTYRSHASVPPGEAWLIPGALMGGETYGYDRGAVIDDAQLEGIWNHHDEFWINSKISAHQHGGSLEVELENLWATFHLPPWLTGAELNLGLMTTETTPSGAWHSSQSRFSEAPLISDVFFGRHFDDTGVSIIKQLGSLTLGAEAWNGTNWPATSSQGATDLFAHWQWRRSNMALKAGVWGMAAEAENRRDDRFDAGHTHGGSLVNDPSSAYRFDLAAIASQSVRLPLYG